MYNIVNTGNGTYGVIEENTNLLLLKGMRLFDAEKFIYSQKHGAGFQGLTPSFMSLGEYNEK